MATDLGELQNKLWEAADQLRANSGLKASEYASPVLGLIFLRYADERFAQAGAVVGPGSDRRPIGPEDYKATGALYLPNESRFETLLHLPEAADIGKALNRAMGGIEEHNPDLKGVLPKDYSRIPGDILGELLRLLRALPEVIEGDGFGLIYEYFLGKFAFAEGRKGGEFFTPTSIVRLIVEILEPFHGKIYDPACGTGGMFVQSAHFVERHREDPSQELSIYGQEKTGDTVRLAKMNLAVHGLGGDIREGNTYYEDLHDSVGKFDFVMANPPFNVNKIDKAKLEDDPRFPFGLPKPDNGNYLWIQTFYSALNNTGRAGFVMANSASDARSSELHIRRKLVEDRSVDVIVAAGTNMFYTVTLPVTLWFLDRAKKHTDRADQVLFIDAREIYNQIDRAHREWTPQQTEFLANIVRLYRRKGVETTSHESQAMLGDHFPDGEYVDVQGLCKLVSIEELDGQSWVPEPRPICGCEARWGHARRRCPEASPASGRVRIAASGGSATLRQRRTCDGCLVTFSTKAFQVSEIAADRRYAVVGGPFGSKLGRKDYTTEGVPVLRGSNLPLEKRIDLTGLVFVTAEKVEKDLFGNLAHPGDIVVTQRGTLGQVGLIPTDSVFERFVVSQSQMKLTALDSAKADGRFVYYYLKSPATTKRLIDRASSSGVPHINLEVFRNFDVELPDLDIQRSVADILTLFDDLIENNRRRIGILEGMARLLYREWFVHFRYPGHEDVWSWSTPTSVQSPRGGGSCPLRWHWRSIRGSKWRRNGKTLSSR